MEYKNTWWNEDYQITSVSVLVLYSRDETYAGSVGSVLMNRDHINFRTAWTDGLQAVAIGLSKAQIPVGLCTTEQYTTVSAKIFTVI